MVLEYLIVRYIHLIAMGLGVGGATIAAILLRKSEKNPELAPAFMNAMKPISKLIWVSLILLVLSGFAFPFFSSRSYSPFIFSVKIAVVLILVIDGLVINFVLNPRLQKSMPKGGVSPEFIKIRKYMKIGGAIALIAWYVIPALAVAMLYLGE